ncbi:MAG: protein O-mannosyl-transferase [Verrucomicrobiota bacterium]|jgi:tetratricopeptide (TPR) repeat protein
MKLREVTLSILLVALVWIVFGQTLAHDFVNYDDRVYVTQVPQVNGGLTMAGIAWAFAHAHAGNWHPLTTISHMLDCQLFGLRPRAHHAVNVALHTCAVLLLFAFLRTTTGRIWSSAFVAGVFAIHPLRVESVAWIAERKDVLSAFFFMLTLIAYAQYARRPSLRRYMTMSILAACGLMSKPMLVTLPLVLLLIDYWPLARSTSSRLLIEKIPLFAMSLVLGIVTYVIQEHSPGALAQLPVPWRIENAVVSYVLYIGQLFWPSDLIVFYPHPENHLAMWQVASAAALLIAITIAAFRSRLTKPYLFVGWLWYVAMLLPVIGIIEVGLQGHADRYTYLPQIGLVIALTWLIVDLATSLRWRREIVAAAAVVVVLSLTACAWKQTRVWKNSEILWTHALAVSPENDVAHTNMGIVLIERGRNDDALAHLQTALNLRGRSSHSHYDLSLALIYTNLGFAFAQRGDVDQAISHLRAATEMQPRYPDAHYNLAVVLAQTGDIDAAIGEYEKVLSLRPDDIDARISLANALLQKHRLRDAIAHYDAALKAAPHAALAANNLAWVLATTPEDALRDGARALKLARVADQHSDGTNVVFIRTMAAAQAEIGRFDDAKATAQIALQIARANNDVDLARELEDDVDLYQNQRPLRDPNLRNAR